MKRKTWLRSSRGSVISSDAGRAGHSGLRESRSHRLLLWHWRSLRFPPDDGSECRPALYKTRASLSARIQAVHGRAPADSARATKPARRESSSAWALFSSGLDSHRPGVPDLGATRFPIRSRRSPSRRTGADYHSTGRGLAVDTIAEPSRGDLPRCAAGARPARAPNKLARPAFARGVRETATPVAKSGTDEEHFVRPRNALSFHAPRKSLELPAAPLRAAFARHRHSMD